MGSSNLRIGISSGSLCSSLEIPLMVAITIFFTATTSGFGKLATGISFCLTWNTWSLYPICNRCRFNWRWIWDLTKSQQSVSIGKITNRGAFPADSTSDIIGLLPSLVRHRYPRGETPKQENSFINKFMAVKGDSRPPNFERLGGYTWSRKHGGQEWWVMLSNNWGSHCYNLVHAQQSGPFNTVFLKVIIIPLPCWSCITLSPVHSSPRVEN